MMKKKKYVKCVLLKRIIKTKYKVNNYFIFYTVYVLEEILIGLSSSFIIEPMLVKVVPE